MIETIATVAAAIISSAALVAVAVIQTHAAADKKRTEARARRREVESRLSMELMSATMDLAYVTSLAVTGGHVNGNVEAAQEKAEKANDKYKEFLRAEAAHAVVKI